MIRAFLVMLVSLGLTIAASAAERATLEEAKAMAMKAADHIRAVGNEAAYKDFSTKDGPAWHDRELYVFVNDDEGYTVANGGNAALIGKKMWDLRDVDGKLFVRDFLAVKDTGTVDFKWRNPVNNAIEQKSAYIVRVGKVIVGVGIYKPN